MKYAVLLYSLVFTILTLLSVLDSIEPPETSKYIASTSLRTGDILLFGECAVLKTLQMSPYSHAAVCVLNRKNIPYSLEIGPKHGCATLTPVKDLSKNIRVRKISRQIDLKAALQYIYLVRYTCYKLPLLKASFCLRLGSDDLFCSSLVSGFFIFTGVMPATTMNYLPKDFALRIPTKNGYSFGPVISLRS